MVTALLFRNSLPVVGWPVLPVAPRVAPSTSVVPAELSRAKRQGGATREERTVP